MATFDTQSSSTLWISPAQPLIPSTWLKTGPCEIIRALNANGSPAHSLFSPGSWVPESAVGPMSDCSQRTNLRMRRSDKNPLHCFLRPCPRPGSRWTPGRSLEHYTACACVRTHAGADGQPWAAGRGFSPIVQPSRDWWGQQREECGRREEGQVMWPADNTWPEPDRADIRTWPHLCSGKATPGAGGRQTKIEFQQCT